MEQWRDVCGYEGIYQVSDLGRVKSLNRPSNARNGKIKIIKGRILNQRQTPSGYVRVSLCKNGLAKDHYIHRIVAESFIGPSDLAVDHINSVKTDNMLSNPRYVSNRENSTYHFLKQNTTSKHIGVCFNKKEKKWESAITIRGKKKFLGLFKNENDAADAYQNALQETNQTFDFQ